MNWYDVAYGVGVGVTSPFWLTRTKWRRKVLRALRERMGHFEPWGGEGPLIIVHAVSLAEMNATRELIRGLAGTRSELRFLVTSTTDTGYARGLELYKSEPRVRVERFPLDFSAGVLRLLSTFRPAAVVLMELEVWPNFMRQCSKRGVPVAVVNGRLTEGSYRQYLRGRLITRGMFARLSAVCAQEEGYARRFESLGVRPDRLCVTGTMKFDTAQVADRLPGAEELAAEVGIHAGERVWVCGSTGPGEEEMALRVYGALQKQMSDLRLVIVPRKPERFEEVAEMIRAAGFALVRRSKPGAAKEAVILGDTMGELRKFYSLASVVFVGRSLADLGAKQHGSDMIEPAGLAKPTIVGPFTTNFAEVMDCFREAKAMVEVADAEMLKQTVERLLSDAGEARRLGLAAQQVVLQGKGATQRNVEAILRIIPEGWDERPAGGVEE